MSRKRKHRHRKRSWDNSTGMRVFVGDGVECDGIKKQKKSHKTILPNQKTNEIFSSEKSVREIENALEKLVSNERDKANLARIIISLRVAQCEGIISFENIKNSLTFIKELVEKNSLYILNNDIGVERLKVSNLHSPS